MTNVNRLTCRLTKNFLFRLQFSGFCEKLRSEDADLLRSVFGMMPHYPDRLSSR